MMINSSSSIGENQQTISEKPEGAAATAPSKKNLRLNDKLNSIKSNIMTDLGHSIMKHTQDLDCLELKELLKVLCDISVPYYKFVWEVEI